MTTDTNATQDNDPMYRERLDNTDAKPTQSFIPMEFDRSKLRYYSMGKLAHNKELDSWQIEAYPIEILPFADGEITDHINEYEASGKDYLEGSYSVKVDTTLTIKAEWFPWGQDNRLTPPDVRRGERVMLLQYAETDKYYWFKVGDDRDLRKLETVIWAISATPDEKKKTEFDTSYSVEVSSHRKHIKIHTSQANEEVVIYDIEINPGTGHILITDNIGNFISMDSLNHRIELMNADESHYDMHRTNLTITTKDSIVHNTSRYEVNADTIRHRARVWDKTTAPLIEEYASNLNRTHAPTIVHDSVTGENGEIHCGGRAISRASYMEITTMDCPDGHIIEETQNRIIKANNTLIAPIGNNDPENLSRRPGDPYTNPNMIQMVSNQTDSFADSEKYESKTSERITDNATQTVNETKTDTIGEHVETITQDRTTTIAGNDALTVEGERKERYGSLNRDVQENMVTRSKNKMEHIQHSGVIRAIDFKFATPVAFKKIDKYHGESDNSSAEVNFWWDTTPDIDDPTDYAYVYEDLLMLTAPTTDPWPSEHAPQSDQDLWTDQWPVEPDTP